MLFDELNGELEVRSLSTMCIFLERYFISKTYFLPFHESGSFRHTLLHTLAVPNLHLGFCSVTFGVLLVSSLDYIIIEHK